MKAEITIEQVWYNASLLNFFFRTQAENTLNELIDRCKEVSRIVLESIEEYANDNDLDIDSIEEMFYGDTVEELADEFGLELNEEEEEEEEEEEDEDLYDLYEECHRP